MRYPLILLGIFTFIFGPPSAPEQGEAAWTAGEYRKAVEFYRMSMEHYGDQQDQLSYNIAQSWMAVDSLDSALAYFQKVNEKNTPLVASDALNNVGVLSVRQQAQAPAIAQQTPATAGEAAADPQMQAIDQALVVLRQSMRNNPLNETARYNYELLMKRKQQQEQQQQQPPPQEQEEEEEKEKEEQQRDSQSQPQQRPSESQSVKSDPVDERQADQLMEALKENEKRFIQQLKKKPHRQPQGDGRPQW